MKRMILATVLTAIVVSGCGPGFFTRKPWRTYDLMPFDSQKWRDGDPIDRGRMLRDMREKIVGKNESEVIEMLGEPDEKMRQNGQESWLYTTEHPGRRTYLQTGVEFDRKGKARISSFDKDGSLDIQK